ncbi:MAG: ABC transporter substrate-binding protein [Paludibacter sp.]|nr:ABC transporter substrate-binding protein [Paludibacter sp.]
MLKLILRFAFCAMLFCLVCCKTKRPKDEEKIPNESLKIEFARGFSVNYYTDYKLVSVKNYRNPAVPDIRYYLVQNPQTPTPSDGQKIVVPLRTLACGSATLYESLNLIGEINSVIAVTNAKTAYNQTIRDGFAAGKISNLGDALNINVEKVLINHPSALIMSGYDAADVRAERIAHAGIPLIINNDWQEENILGRAEWIKFVSAFFNKEKIADSIFSEIVIRYQSAKNSTIKFTKKPTVMSGVDFRGTWYMPGGQNFMAQLFADADADYFYKNNNATTSLRLTFETVLQNFSNADFWINCDYNSFAQLRAANEKNMLFKAAKNRNVWNFNRRMLPDGANDFWESAVTHPDLLLLDLIHILHQQNDDYQLVYAKNLE